MPNFPIFPKYSYPDNKVHGANMGPTWVLSARDGPHVGPMNITIRVIFVVCWHYPLRSLLLTIIQYSTVMTLSTLFYIYTIRILAGVNSWWFLLAMYLALAGNSYPDHIHTSIPRVYKWHHMIPLSWNGVYHNPIYTRRFDISFLKATKGNGVCQIVGLFNMIYSVYLVIKTACI